MDISGFGYGMSSDPGIIRWIKGRKSLVLVTHSVLQGKKGISTTSQVYAPEKILFPPPAPKRKQGVVGPSVMLFPTARGENSGRPRTDGISSFAPSKETSRG